MANVIDSLIIEDNVVVKAVDINYIGESAVNNLSLLLQQLLYSNKNTILNGLTVKQRGTPSLNVDVEAGLAFDVTLKQLIHNGVEYGPVAFEAADGSNSRIDVVQIRQVEDTYDNQQRIFRDPINGVNSYANIDVKNSYITEFVVKKGTAAGSPVAPTVDAGYIKLAEVTIAALATTIVNANIKNVDTGYNGGSNTGWSTEPTVTFRTESLSFLKDIFRLKHTESGDHGVDVIRDSNIDWGINANQVDADIVPLGTAISNVPTGGTTSTLANTSFVRAALTELFARLLDLSGVTNDAVKDRHIDWGVGAGQVMASRIPILDAALHYTAANIEAALLEVWTKYDYVIQNEKELGDTELPAGSTYWNFGSPNLTNSAGVAPTIRHNVSFIQSTATPPFFANRGCRYLNKGYVTWLYTFANEMVLALRFLPNFAYDSGTAVSVFDNGSASGSEDNGMRLYFYSTAGGCKLCLIVQDDATHRFLINTNEYTNNGQLQIEHSIFVRVSKAGNNVDLYVNGALIVNGVNGTVTILGGAAAITGIDLTTKTEIALGCVSWTEAYSSFSATNFYIQDLWINPVYATTYLADWTPATQKPYFIPASWLSGYKQNWQITAEGDCGFRNGSFETININSVDTGGGQEKTKKIPIGVWDMNATATVNITHGVALNKILSITAMIINDTLSQIFDLVYSSGTANVNGSIQSIDGSIVILARHAGAGFTSALYNDGTINRGYVTFKYLV
ncbi:MAG: hypothetical protein WC516_06590 [Patescibacteria group bacterium]|jgi:hypothetical protein